MCRGHSLYRVISLAASDIPAFNSTRPDHVTVDLENEIKLMYARGEIGPEAFRQLQNTVQKRELKVQDLGAFQHRSVDLPRQYKSVHIEDRESKSAYSRELRQQRRYLEAACAQTEESIYRLQIQTALLYKEAETRDETSEKKAYVVSRAESVEQRMRIIGGDCMISNCAWPT